MWKLVKESIFKRRMSSVSVVLSVMLAAASAVTLAVVYGGVQAGVDLNERRSGAQIVVVPEDASNEISNSELLFTGAPAPIYFSTAIADEIMSDEGIARSTVQFFGQTLDESCCSSADATRLIGIDFPTDWTVSSFAHIELDEGLGEGRIVTGFGVGSKVGDVVKILGVPYTVADVLDATGTELDTAILMDIGIARDVCGNQEEFAHYWEKYGSPNGLVSCVLMDVDEEVVSTDRVLNRVNSTEGVVAFERSAVVEESRDSLSALFSVMFVVGILLILSSAVQLFARFYGCVWSRKAELALYRALGASAADLRKMIGMEMAVLLGVGLVLGIACGLCLQVVVLDVMVQTASFPFVAMGSLQVAGLVAAVAAAFALMGVGSIVWPLRQVGRLQPSVAMQQADID